MGVGGKALKPMTIPGPQEQHVALGQGLHRAVDMVTGAATLHPEQFGKIVIVQHPGAVLGQGRAHEVIGLAGLQEIRVAESAMFHEHRLSPENS